MTTAPPPSPQGRAGTRAAARGPLYARWHGGAVWRQHADRGGEILGRVVHLSGEEGELSAIGVELLPADTVQGVGEAGRGIEEAFQPGQGTGFVALLCGGEQGLGDLAGGAGLDEDLEQLLHRPLGRGLGPVEARRGVRPQDSGRGCARQGLTRRPIRVRSARSPPSPPYHGRPPGR